MIFNKKILLIISLFSSINYFVNALNTKWTTFKINNKTNNNLKFEAYKENTKVHTTMLPKQKISIIRNQNSGLIGFSQYDISLPEDITSIKISEINKAPGLSYTRAKIIEIENKKLINSKTIKIKPNFFNKKNSLPSGFKNRSFPGHGFYPMN